MGTVALMKSDRFDLEVSFSSFIFFNYFMDLIVRNACGISNEESVRAVNRLVRFISL